MNYAKYDQMIRSGFRFVRYINGHKAVFENIYSGYCVVYDYIRDIYYKYREA